MTTPETPFTDADGDCSTTTSFEDHGLIDGSDLVHNTYYRLLDAGVDTFEPTDAFFDGLESAFLWSYMHATEDSGVPPHVEAAIGDARERTRELYADTPDVDLRVDVIPTFYQEVAGFHCIYR